MKQKIAVDDSSEATQHVPPSVVFLSFRLNNEQRRHWKDDLERKNAEIRNEKN